MRSVGPGWGAACHQIRKLLSRECSEFKHHISVGEVFALSRLSVNVLLISLCNDVVWFFLFVINGVIWLRLWIYVLFIYLSNICLFVIKDVMLRLSVYVVFIYLSNNLVCLFCDKRCNIYYLFSIYIFLLFLRCFSPLSGAFFIN